MTFDYKKVAREAVEVEDEKAQQELYDRYVEQGYDRSEILRAVRELSLNITNSLRPLKVNRINNG